MRLHRPIGIFDAGIGSYAIVERVRASFPLQEIIYFADRASFPYGGKTPAELLATVQGAASYLCEQECQAVVLASNAPSVVVLDALRATIPVPVLGIFPPLREALCALEEQTGRGVRRSIAGQQRCHARICRQACRPQTAKCCWLTRRRSLILSSALAFLAILLRPGKQSSSSSTIYGVAHLPSMSSRCRRRIYRDMLYSH